MLGIVAERMTKLGNILGQGILGNRVGTPDCPHNLSTRKQAARLPGHEQQHFHGVGMHRDTAPLSHQQTFHGSDQNRTQSKTLMELHAHLSPGFRATLRKV
jgi:hypothetical protein